MSSLRAAAAACSLPPQGRRYEACCARPCRAALDRSDALRCGAIRVPLPRNLPFCRTPRIRMAASGVPRRSGPPLSAGCVIRRATTARRSGGRHAAAECRVASHHQKREETCQARAPAAHPLLSASATPPTSRRSQTDHELRALSQLPTSRRLRPSGALWESRRGGVQPGPQGRVPRAPWAGRCRCRRTRSHAPAADLEALGERPYWDEVVVAPLQPADMLERDLA